ncbi:MFS transporter [Agathobaculum sp.]|uniref:MFS transporter n=1 Tax=Agathobaculum sp. TaxID=2048138 RepID=UPI002A820FBD|nr:MFS transporter [Agathobaculum sp.]MDY3619315.1 MFS transporter [Agathobaculum sp.]
MLKQPWKRKFFTIMAGQTVSLVGSGAVQFALIWWLASETGSPLMMALSGLVAFLPQTLLGPFAGVWIDRMKRKTVVMAADLFQGLVALAFAAAFLLKAPPYWSACLVLGVRSVGTVFQTPAMQALIPQLVPQDELVRVGAWQQFLQSGAFMLGPVLGALMYGALPLPVILLTDLLGALAANLTLGVTKIDEPPHTHAEAPHFLREFRAGWQALTADKPLCALLLAAGGCMVFFMPLASYYPLMTSDYFNLSAFHGGIVEFTYALGMLLTSCIVGLFGHIKHKLLFAHLGLLGIGLSTLVAGLTPPSIAGFWVFAVACTFLGGSGNFYGIPTVAYMQEAIPQEAQGRVFSLMGSLLSLTMPLGLLLSGPVAEAYGVARWFLISGIAILIIPIISLLVIRRLKNV